MSTDDYRSRGPELLADLVDKTVAMLVSKADLDPDTAHSVARELADLISEDWGGQQLYIPKGISIKAAERGLEMYRRWDGTTHHLAELAKEYGYSIQWAYRVIKAARKEEIAKRQGDLFPS